MKPILFAPVLAMSLAVMPVAAVAQDAHAGHGDHAAHAQAQVSAEEAMLRTTIAALQAGTPNYDDMVPALADAVRDQEAAMAPMLAGLGGMQGMEHQGVVQGAQHYRVTFENGPTNWFIALDEAGKIASLFFQPAV
ncbi:hypothetical protein [Brevundimonas sp.]|uniref:hypothetical protein n=1 Tax=Brevundimonas sp. TaxID=1871086 RepID=UPI00391C8BDD